MTTYIVAFRRNDSIGTEEYDGGGTLQEARKEADFFSEHLPAYVTIRICEVVGNVGNIKTVEYVKRA